MFSKTPIKILKFFYTSSDKVLFRWEIGYSYERINSSLKYLTKNKLVIEEQKGKTLVYSLNLKNLYVKIGFKGYMLERKRLLKKMKLYMVL